MNEWRYFRCIDHDDEMWTVINCRLVSNNSQNSKKLNFTIITDFFFCIFRTRESSNFNHFFSLDMTIAFIKNQLTDSSLFTFRVLLLIFACCTIYTQKRIHTNTLPVSSRSLSGLRFSTELRFDGIGKLGFGRFCKAAKACCTAS